MKVVRNLFSAKQVGTLYHYTCPRSMGDIIRLDTLMGRGGPVREGHPEEHRFPGDRTSCSFTRDKNFHRHHRSSIDLRCRLVVDGDRLSSRVKFVPHDYFWNDTDPDEVFTQDPRSYDKNMPGYGVDPERWGKRPGMDEMEELAILPPGKEDILDILSYTHRIEYARGVRVEYYSEEEGRYLASGDEAWEAIQEKLEEHGFDPSKVFFGAY